MKDNILQVVALSRHKVPECKEVRGKQWVLFGEKNDYPDYLIGLYNRSAKHNAIVSGKVHYITGKGMRAKNGEDKRAQAFLAQPNKYESLNELLYKAALDLELFGGFALEVMYGKASGRAEEVYHVPFAKLRTNAEETEYYYTADWTKSQPDKNDDYRVYRPFSAGERSGTRLFYYKQYTPKRSATDVYPLPEYLGCVPYIEIDYEIANFHLNNIKNGFWGSFMISFFDGNASEDEKRSMEQKLKKRYEGTDNAGRFILNTLDDPAKKPALEALTPPELDKMFIELNKQVQQEIFTGHKVTSPMLFGIKTEGQLGGRTEILEASELFKNTYVNNRQLILERAINLIAASAGVVSGLSIEPTEAVSSEVNQPTKETE